MIPAVALLLFSAIVVFLLNVPYRFLLNQNEAAAIKSKAKELQERAKAAQKEGNAKLSSQLLHESLLESGKMTRLTMKPMLISMLIAVMVLPFLGNTYNDVTAAIKDGAGEAKLNGNTYMVAWDGKSLKINDAECALPCRKTLEGGLWNAVPEGSSVVFQRIVALLPVSMPVFGDDAGWLGWYFIVSIPTMILWRKLLKITL